MVKQFIKENCNIQQYECYGNLTVVCGLVNDGLDAVSIISNNPQQNRNKYTIQIDQCCPNKDQYDYYFEFKAIQLNMASQQQIDQVYGNAEVQVGSSGFVNTVQTGQFLKGYIQSESIQDHNNYYINTVIKTSLWPSNKVSGNSTTNVPSGILNNNIPCQVPIVGRYDIHYNNLYNQNGSGLYITTCEVKKIYSQKFKVDGMNFSFQLSTDDITGTSKKPIPLNEIGLQNTIYQNTSFTVTFDIYRQLKD